MVVHRSHPSDTTVPQKILPQTPCTIAKNPAPRRERRRATPCATAQSSSHAASPTQTPREGKFPAFPPYAKKQARGFSLGHQIWQIWVPHPFRVFQRKGWESDEAPVHTHPNRALVLQLQITVTEGAGVSTPQKQTQISWPSQPAEKLYFAISFERAWL